MFKIPGAYPQPSPAPSPVPAPIRESRLKELPAEIVDSVLSGLSGLDLLAMAATNKYWRGRCAAVATLREGLLEPAQIAACKEGAGNPLRMVGVTERLFSRAAVNWELTPYCRTLNLEYDDFWGTDYSRRARLRNVAPIANADRVIAGIDAMRGRVSLPEKGTYFIDVLTGAFQLVTHCMIERQAVSADAQFVLGTTADDAHMRLWKFAPQPPVARRWPWSWFSASRDRPTHALWGPQLARKDCIASAFFVEAPDAEPFAVTVEDTGTVMTFGLWSQVQHFFAIPEKPLAIAAETSTGPHVVALWEDGRFERRHADGRLLFEMAPASPSEGIRQALFAPEAPRCAVLTVNDTVEIWDFGMSKPTLVCCEPDKRAPQLHGIDALGLRLAYSEAADAERRLLKFIDLEFATKRSVATRYPTPFRTIGRASFSPTTPLVSVSVQREDSSSCHLLVAMKHARFASTALDGVYWRDLNFSQDGSTVWKYHDDEIVKLDLLRVEVDAFRRRAV